MIVLWISLGTVLGLVIGFLIAERRSGGAHTEHAISKEQLRQATQNLADHQASVADLRLTLAAEQQDRAALDAQLAASKEVSEQHRLHHVGTTEQLRSAIERHDTLFARHNDLHNQHAAATAQLEAERKSLGESREHFADAKNRIREAFAELSNDALQKNSRQFFDLASQTFKTLQTEATGGLEEKKSQIAAMLQPMSLMLDQYKQSVDKIETTSSQAYVSIEKQLASVAATQLHLSQETRQLVTALRKPQARGQWGEMTLRRLFEMAGLTARVSFDEQVSLTTDDGRLRPDCIVRMPRGRHVIVDSKCVLDAFLDASSSEDDGQRVAHLARHAKQVRSRIDELARKDYFESFKGSAEFTVLFLPGEAFLYAAVEHDPKLIEDALRQHVLIAAPSTLLGMLRVIDHAWRQQAIEDNANEIRQQADELYKRLAVLSEHFDKLGNALGTATAHYNNTLRSLERNVFTQARRLSKLGISAAKPVKMLSEIEQATHDLKPSSWSGLPEAAADLDLDLPDSDLPETSAALPELTAAESAALDGAPVPSAQS